MSNSQNSSWNFDVSSLMILLGEAEEERYRLGQPSLLQCLVAVPVVAMQSYIRSYDFLLHAAKFEYFSPYGVKTAPLRYMRLSNAIENSCLLQDGSYHVYRIPSSDDHPPIQAKAFRHFIYTAVWTLTTWALFAAIIAYCICVSGTTWIGLANCAGLTGWSAILRLIEWYNLERAPIDEAKVTAPADPDAVFVLGRRNSAFVLEGMRLDVKHWTSRGLRYRPRTAGIPARFWQALTRIFSMMMMVFVFSTIPNGSTTDQVVFIIINGLAQVNVLVGQYLQRSICLDELVSVDSKKPTTRTAIYGLLCRRFRAAEARRPWIDESGMLPHTNIWQSWKKMVLEGDERDANEIYRTLQNLIAKPA